MLNLTKEQARINKKNRNALRKKLGLSGYEYVLHHVDTTMRHNDIERYIQWNEEDVVVMTRGEHTKLHYNDIFTEEARKKCGWCKPGVGPSIGQHWYNNGVKELQDYSCPEGFVKGRLKRYAELNQNQD